MATLHFQEMAQSYLNRNYFRFIDANTALLGD